MLPNLQHIEWSPNRPIIRTDSRIISYESFRRQLEQEALRHKRYLTGFGLVRIGPREGPYGALALSEALETETRLTDTVCSVDDGSYVVLVLESEEPGLLAVARRIVAVADEIGREAGCPAPVCAGIAASGRRRVAADEIWVAAANAWDLARTGDTYVVSSCG